MKILISVKNAQMGSKGTFKILKNGNIPWDHIITVLYA